MAETTKTTVGVGNRLHGLVLFLNRRAVFFYIGLLSFFFLSVAGGVVLWLADYAVWEIANKQKRPGSSAA